MINEKLLQEVIQKHLPKAFVGYGQQGFMCQVHYPELCKIIKDYEAQQQVSVEPEVKPEIAEWISVKDRLPDDCKTVIVSGGLGYYSFISNQWFTITHTDTPRPISWEVTHWMPLPEPPKENRVCHYCGGTGYRAIPNHYTDEPEQIQCEYCYNTSPKEKL